MQNGVSKLSNWRSDTVRLSWKFTLQEVHVEIREVTVPCFQGTESVWKQMKHNSFWFSRFSRSVLCKSEGSGSHTIKALNDKAGTDYFKFIPMVSQGATTASTSVLKHMWFALQSMYVYKSGMYYLTEQYMLCGSDCPCYRCDNGWRVDRSYYITIE